MVAPPIVPAEPPPSADGDAPPVPSCPLGPESFGAPPVVPVPPDVTVPGVVPPPPVVAPVLSSPFAPPASDASEQPTAMNRSALDARRIVRGSRCVRHFGRFTFSPLPVRRKSRMQAEYHAFSAAATTGPARTRSDSTEGA